MFQTTSTVEQRPRAAARPGSRRRCRASGRGSRRGPPAAAAPGSARAARPRATNVTAFTQYARIGPLGATIRPPHDRADHPGQVLDRLQQRRRRGSSLVVDEVRHARRRRPGGRTRSRRPRPPRARRSPSRCRRTAARRTRRRGRGRRRSAAARRESRSTSGASSSPIRMIGRKSTIRSALTHLPEPVRSKTSTVSAIGGEIRPDAGAERCEEEAPEVGREAEDGEAEDARTLTAARQKPAAFIRPARSLPKARRSPSADARRGRDVSSRLRRGHGRRRPCAG